MTRSSWSAVRRAWKRTRPEGNGLAWNTSISRRSAEASGRSRSTKNFRCSSSTASAVTTSCLAEILLAEPVIAHGAAFAIEEAGREVGALGGGDAPAVPLAAARGPGVVEEAPGAGGSAEGDDGAFGGGDGRTEGAVGFVGDKGGLIDHKEVGGETAGGFGDAGQGDDAGAVGEEERVFIAAVGAGRDVEAAEEGAGLGATR